MLSLLGLKQGLRGLRSIAPNTLKSRGLVAPTLSRSLTTSQSCSALGDTSNPFLVSSSLPAPSTPFSSFLFSHTFSTAAAEIQESAPSAEQKFAHKLKRFKPTSPGRRHTVLVDRSELWKGKPIKALCRPRPSKGGRGHGGKISVRHRGGGHKRRYRLVDFKRQVYDIPAIVQRLEYDPNRSAYIALISYEDGRLSYILAPQGLGPGDSVQSSRENELSVSVGNSMPLSSMPIGTFVHNVELYPGHGGVFGRSAGCACQIIDKTGKPGYVLVRLSSKEQRYIKSTCMATIGILGNPLHRLRKLGKAGRKRWMGFRPTVRGVAMNPVDHPHGGGEGKVKGRLSCSPTGVLSKGGFKTRKRKPNKLVVVARGGLRKAKN